MKTRDVRRALVSAFSRFRFNSAPQDDALQVGILFALNALKLVNHRQYIAVSTYHGLLNEVSVHPSLDLAVASLEAAVKDYFDHEADDAAVYRIIPGRSDTEGSTSTVTRTRKTGRSPMPSLVLDDTWLKLPQAPKSASREGKERRPVWYIFGSLGKTSLKTS